jgi:trehalose 6-phosphate synthase/phosphatase
MNDDDAAVSLLKQLSSLHNRLASSDIVQTASSVCAPIRVFVVSQGDSCLAFKQACEALTLDTNVTLKWIDVQITDEASEFVDLSLFPVFHSSTSASSIEMNASGYEKLTAVTEKAADTLQVSIGATVEDGSVIVIVQGISLLLLPRLLHSRLSTDVNVIIAFVLTCPFPDEEFFRTIPRRTELLHGLIGGSNLVITGDEKSVEHIKEAATLLLGLDCGGDFIVCGDNHCRIECIPLLENECKLPQQEDKDIMLGEIGKGLPQEKDLMVIVAVDDAVDATRCIILKLLAIEDLLETHKELQGMLLFIYLLGSSPQEHRNAALVEKIKEVVSEINGRYSSPTWTPILLIRSPLSLQKKIALFSICKAGLFTSLRDVVPLGLSEFITANETSDPAVAIVSEFSGSCSRLASTLLVNPVDTRSTARALFKAISCDKEERIHRHDDLMKWVQGNCAKKWAIRFMSSKKLSQEAELKRRQLTKLDIEQITSVYSNCTKRLIFIGSWSCINPSHVSGALEFDSPTDNLRLTLTQLSQDPLNTVWLSTTGIPSAIIDAWFGDLSIGLVGENGYRLRWPPKTTEIEQSPTPPTLAIAEENEHLQRHKALLQSSTTRKASIFEKCLGKDDTLDWLEETIEIMRYFTERTPGASLQVLESSAIFSFSGADVEFGQLQARDLMIHLNSILYSTTAQATLSQAKKSVTVSLKSTSRGHVLSHLLRSYEEHQQNEEKPVPYFDFFLGLCDDEIDPAVDNTSHFPKDRNFSVAVGGPSTAGSGSKFLLENPEHAVRLLHQLGVKK